VWIPLALLLASVPPKIVDRPIRFDAARKQLMLEYRRAHEDPRAEDLTITPRVIVIHHTAFDTLEASFAYFDRTTIEAERKQIAAAGRANVSAHFLVDRDGTIYRLMPETWMARHCIGLNHVSIGIENVGGTAKTPLTDAQLEANAALVRELAARFPITHLIGHHEYLRLEKHEYFVERDRSYRTQKIDPGPAFMERLRSKLVDLTLRSF
jgi:N-acetyl-anhydromuramyl-L-alanine amidase AmpD